MKNAFIIFFVFLSFVARSQKPVPDLITDRPDQTESSSLVPLHAFQIETGFVMENKYVGNYTHKYFAYNTTVLRYGISNNLGLEWDGNTAASATFYSAAFGFGITEKLALFAESYGLIYEFDEAEHLLDTGFTYLISPNFQLDVSAGMGINDLAIDNFISFGFTYRFLY